MNPNLLFDFTVDKATKTIQVKREFSAPLDMVWAAWTTPEILDKWWAPKPYKTKTKYMDFSEGGYWLYGMVSPEEHIHWCKNSYLKIHIKKEYVSIDAFCDEEGVVNTSMPRTQWTNTFTDKGEITLISLTAVYNSIEELETVIKMGFKEGFTMALNNLDDVLSNS